MEVIIIDSLNLTQEQEEIGSGSERAEGDAAASRKF